MGGLEWILLIACVLGGWLWLDTLSARDRGVAAAREYCKREGVQLLDDTAVLRRISLGRNDDGRATLRRLYEFEYSVTGDDRFRGSVTLFGREVEWLDFSAHRH